MQDLLQIETQLPPETLQIQKSIRDYVDRTVTPKMLQAYETGQFPQEFIAELANLGVFGATLPTEYGGAAASHLTYGIICQELERGDSALRSFVSVQSSLGMYPIYRFGNEQQKQTYLPKLARAELISCFGLTEPDSGSDPASMKTHAKKVAGGWLLNGSKMWITNAPIADIAIIWAKTPEGIRGFIVEKTFQGFQANEIHHKMSLRASITGEISLQDCFVPDSHLLPGSNTGLTAALNCLTQARYGIAWGAIGAAQACFDIALDYTKNRVQFAKPLASFQLVQQDLVEMFNEICKAKLLNLRVAELMDAGKADFNMVSLAKMNAAKQALIIARAARNLLGGNGITLEYQVIRHMMNLETVFTYEGTNNIHHLIVGRYLTGISAFE